MSVTLASGEWQAELRPEAGGALASLTRNGLEVLQTMPPGSFDPLEGACFPLVPYCNRIRDGRFAWQGREVRLPANFAPEPHSLHGLGWQAPWRVTSEGGFKASLTHRYEGAGAWPWAYDAEQRIRLGSQGCAITLDVTNRADTPMPCGLGLHPYFRRRPETRVRFAAGGMLEVDEGLIPTGEVSAPDSLADWRAGPALPARLVDHCFAGWDGAGTIEDDFGTIELTARGASFLHIYAPPDGSAHSAGRQAGRSGQALCLEPVSHAPDALNRAPDEMIALPPGCTASLTLRIGAG